MQPDKAKTVLIQSPCLPKVKSLDWNEAKQSLLVGTEGSEIWEIDSSKKATCLMRGHYGDETWGLAVHP